MSQEQLTALYYNARTGLTSAQQFWNRVKGKGFTRKAVFAFVKKQAVAQRMKRYTKPKAYYPITAKNSTTYQADLVQMQWKARGHRYILTCINIINRRAYAVPLKRKHGGVVAAAMRKLLGHIKRDGDQMTHLSTDMGSEFVASQFRKLMAGEGIQHRMVDPEMHHRPQGKIERWHLTLKRKLNTIMEAKGSKDWARWLPDAVHNYNTSIHSSIGRAPAEMERRNEAVVKAKDATKTRAIQRKDTFQVGDTVRLLRNKKTFEKDGPRYTVKVYTIVKKNPLSYKLEGLKRTVQYYEMLKVGKVEGGAKDPQHVRAKAKDASGKRRARRRARTGVGVAPVKKPKRAKGVMTRTGKGGGGTVAERTKRGGRVRKVPVRFRE